MEEKTIETIMTAVCDLCHWPYVEENQDALDRRCANCPVESVIRELCKGKRLGEENAAR